VGERKLKRRATIFDKALFRKSLRGFEEV